MRLSIRENGSNPEGCAELPEEKLVDYAMRQLEEHERIRVEVHAAACPHCRDRLAEWEAVTQSVALGGPEIVSEPTDLEGQPNAAAFGTPMPESPIRGAGAEEKTATETAWPASRGIAGPFAASSAASAPSARLSRKLRMLARLRSVEKGLARQRRYLVPAAAAAVVAGCVVAGLFSFKHREMPAADSIDQAFTSKIAVMQSANYDQYRISPLPPLHGSGGVWIDRHSGEMLIVIEGLQPPEEKAYQVWLQHEQRSISMGMLLTGKAEGKGYYYGYGTMEPDQIVISLEPKGGSLVPTGPEALRVSVDHNRE
ncbi:anti-sigma-K factor RskA [Paenibacillus rhizosphaerae]|uniref:Regulator of SigK n=1 Tax=Paenibacillus rhizosphaerae TaxID=297318 RepID=A0A839TWH1_9BACL|nr:anti-sigma factor [Paenibacillus rhizosphaerae]MBB3129768.1 anti-sigma-K factor RskA [Paenibacillus rhizosphaerae]